MASIYGSAYLTISINTGQDLFQSLLGPSMDELSSAGGWLDWWKEWHSRQEKGWPLELFEHDRNPDFFKEALEGGPIGKRAWCLQERQLSPRILHLLDNGMYIWECPYIIAAGPPVIVLSSIDFPNRNSLIRPHLLCRVVDFNIRYMNQFSRELEIEPKDVPQHWRNFIKDFQKRQLSRPSDRLAAIAGLAQAMKSGGDYLSEIWKDQLPGALLWKRTVPQEGTADLRSLKRFATYRAPSWSWCSIIGSISMNVCSLVIEMYGEIEVSPVESITTRDVSVVWDIKLNAIQNSPWAPMQEGSCITLTGRPHQILWKSSTESGNVIPLFDSIESGYILFDTMDGDTDIPKIITFLPIARLDSTVVGLALEPIDDSTQLHKIPSWLRKELQEPLKFKRIGFISTQFRPELYDVKQQHVSLY